MQKIRKLLIVVLLTAVIGGIAVFVDRYDKHQVDFQLAELILPEGIKISPWTDKKNNISYYFIPSYVDFEEIQLSTKEKQGIKIDESFFNDGDKLLGFKTDQVYIMFDKDNIGHNIMFLKSGETATIFVSTVTGSMDAILQSKKNKEVVRVTVIDKEGNINLNRTDSKIKGRGNATWQREKKPFALLFNESESLLGMKASSKWVLLSNSFDESQIRNAIVFDIAEKTGLSGTSEYEYVNLYLNGEYNGLYMICQSVDTFPERIDADKEDVFLFSAELPERTAEMNYILYAENNEALIDVRIPEKMSSEEVETTQKLISSVDNAIIKNESEIGDLIDIDSWVKKYLIDEIFLNHDCGLTSSYFYTLERDENSKVYAGPIWDYDHILGNKDGFVGPVLNPEILFAKQKYRTNSQRLLWYSELYSNPVFYTSVVKAFEKDFLPYLEFLVDAGIDNLRKKICDSKAIDDIRWESNNENEYEYMKEFLSKRINFLKKIWLENEDYKEVTYYSPGSVYMRAYVPKGSRLSNNPAIMEEFNYCSKWYIEGTEEEYDFDLPVNDNLVLVSSLVKEETGIKGLLISIKSDSKLIEIGVSVLALLFAILFIQLCKRLRRGVT